MTEIKVTLPDESIRTLPEGSTGTDLAADVSRSLAKSAIALKVNGETIDLNKALSDGDIVSVITPDTEDGLYVLRHSTAHVLAQAVLSIWEGATYAIGPPIKDGFYYDFELPDGFLKHLLKCFERRERLFLRIQTDCIQRCLLVSELQNELYNQRLETLILISQDL